jgi:uncharacterized iron-regulated membrane protein
MTLRKLTGKLHLWLGLGSGLIVFVISVAAAVFVFEKELFAVLHRPLVTVAVPPGAQVRDLSELHRAAQRYLGPTRPVASVEWTADPTRSYVFSAYQENEHPTGWFYTATIRYWLDVYVNPYTGRVLGQVDKQTEFFQVVRQLHQNLLLRYDIGSWIVGTATLVFVVLLATGLVLWWPRTAARRRSSFRVKWNARWRRVNYDLHNVTGFYIWLPVLVLAATGLVWSFDWWETSIYRLLGQTTPPVYAAPVPPRRPVFAPGHGPAPLDRLAAHLVRQRPTYELASLYYLPATTTRPVATWEGYLTFGYDGGWRASDSYYYTAADGRLFHCKRQEDKTTGEAWRNSNYDIHTGAIYGWPTQLLAFLASLLAASLPVTGALVWWGRRRKATQHAPLPTGRRRPAVLMSRS